VYLDIEVFAFLTVFIKWRTFHSNICWQVLLKEPKAEWCQCSK